MPKPLKAADMMPVQTGKFKPGPAIVTTWKGWYFSIKTQKHLGVGFAKIYVIS